MLPAVEFQLRNLTDAMWESVERRGGKSLRLGAVPTPEFGPEAALVAMMAGSLNYGTV